ncbi:MAG: hypothetical protein R3291_05825, partial [Thermoplasmata archaeon]|nr:hypothetical protein [Thermoplasmata archaeon]
VLYDEEAELILADRERVYARRGLTMEAYKGTGLGRKPFLPPGLWLIYYTNHRVVGLRDPEGSVPEDEAYAGALRAIDRTQYMGPRVKDHVLEFFEFPLRDIGKVNKRSRKHLKMVVRSEGDRYEFRFRPWGAACRAFSVLISQKQGS